MGLILEDNVVFWCVHRLLNNGNQNMYCARELL